MTGRVHAADTRAPRRRATAAPVALVAAVVASGFALACSGSSKPPAPYRGKPPLDTGRDSAELRRELEATVIENYNQLTLGNLEAYADGVARLREVALIGAMPDVVMIGQGTLRQHDPRPYDGTGVRVLARNLEVGLSRDGSVGWTFDELSLRVPYQDREAALPLRMSSVFVRDIDRWVMVVEHISYPLPVPEILARAQDGTLPSPKRISTRQGRRDLGRLLRALVVEIANANPEQRAALVGQASRRAVTATALSPSEWVVAPPGLAIERRGIDIYAPPTLARLFGERARIDLVDFRLSVAKSRQTAWIVATLRCVRAGDRGDLTIGLRGTFVFERDEFGWALVQSHVSVPVTRDMLDARVFGRGG